MALPGNTVWEIRPGSGSDSNGGGFVSGSTGTDYSQQNSSQYNGTDLIIGSTTTHVTTTSSHSFASADVGNILSISAGSGFTTGRYQIVSVSAGAAVLDRSAGTASSTGGTYVVGGAWASIGQANTTLTASNQNAAQQVVWVKATATITLNSGNGLVWEPSNGCYMYGYTTTRGDGGLVTIQAASGLNFQMMTMQGATLANFLFDGGKLSSVSGINCLKVVNGGSTVHDCKFQNCSQNAIGCSNNSNVVMRCVATNCGGGGNHVYDYSENNGENYFIDCVAYSCPGIGFSGFGGVLIRCIAANLSGGAIGFQDGGSDGPFVMDHCMAYDCAGDGLRITGTSGPQITLSNCIFYGNSGWGINANGGTPNQINANWNAYGGNTSGNLSNLTAGPNDVTLTADPTTAGGSNNFALNSTSGGGAAVKAAGFPGALMVGGTGFADIGPLQSSAGGGGSVTYVINKNTTIFIGDEEGY